MGLDLCQIFRITSVGKNVLSVDVSPCVYLDWITSTRNCVGLFFALESIRFCFHCVRNKFQNIIVFSSTGYIPNIEQRPMNAKYPYKWTFYGPLTINWSVKLSFDVLLWKCKNMNERIWYEFLFLAPQTTKGNIQNTSLSFLPFSAMPVHSLYYLLLMSFFLLCFHSLC